VKFQWSFNNFVSILCKGEKERKKRRKKILMTFVFPFQEEPIKIICAVSKAFI